MNDLGLGISELASLFLIVLLLYLLECICWISPCAFIFALGIRGRGKRRHPGFVWNALDTAGLLANPLPPLSPLLVVQWPAFELTADSIKFPANQHQGAEPVMVPWEKLKVTHSDTKLLCNDTVAFKGSKYQVLEYADLLEQLQKALRGQRGQIIHDWLRKMMNAQAAARRVRVFASRSRWLRIVANLQFCLLFVLVPLAFRSFGTRVWWRVILILVIISITVALEFGTVVKALFPQGKVSWFSPLLSVVLSPVAAVRACDAAARDLLSGYHPLAAAAAVLPDDEFRRFAAEQLRLCRFGDYLDPQYQAAIQRAMEGSIKKKGIDPQELLRPPEPQRGCKIYCPRCLAQYTKTRTQCSDCGYEGLSALRQSRAGD